MRINNSLCCEAVLVEVAGLSACQTSLTAWHIPIAFRCNYHVRSGYTSIRVVTYLCVSCNWHTRSHICEPGGPLGLSRSEHPHGSRVVVLLLLGYEPWEQGTSRIIGCWLATRVVMSCMRSESHEAVAAGNAGFPAKGDFCAGSMTGVIYVIPLRMDQSKGRMRRRRLTLRGKRQYQIWRRAALDYA